MTGVMLTQGYPRLTNNRRTQGVTHCPLNKTISELYINASTAAFSMHRVSFVLDQQIPGSRGGAACADLAPARQSPAAQTNLQQSCLHKSPVHQSRKQPRTCKKCNKTIAQPERGHITLTAGQHPTIHPTDASGKLSAAASSEAAPSLASATKGQQQQHKPKPPTHAATREGGAGAQVRPPLLQRSGRGVRALLEEEKVRATTGAVVDGGVLGELRSKLAAVGIAQADASRIVDAMMRSIGSASLEDMNTRVQSAVYPLGALARGDSAGGMACPSMEAWKTCRGACDSVLRPMIEAEINSTSYMLRVLMGSVMVAEKQPQEKAAKAAREAATGEGATGAAAIRFEVHGELTGVWAHDAPLLSIAFMGSGGHMQHRHKAVSLPASRGLGSSSSRSASTQYKPLSIAGQLLPGHMDRLPPRPSGRLIMGFGPSASGKTYWAQTLLNLFTAADSSFPKALMCIDGGIHRSTSLVYSAVVQATRSGCLRGLDNLVLPGMSLKLGVRTLFSSSTVKKQQVAFLQRQTHLPVSLYVPETLGDCDWVPLGALGKAVGASSCADKYAAYRQITGDEAWIGLLIWQHKSGGECDQVGARRCMGCMDSGTAREEVEGKRYSSTAYDHSMKEGGKAIQSAPGGCYKIHNGGARGRVSMFQDFSVYTDTTAHVQRALELAQEQYAYVYQMVAATTMPSSRRSSPSSSPRRV
jgi:hypothetical protein